MAVIDELAIAGILIAAIATVSCLSVDGKRLIRALPKTAWIAVILLVPPAGPAAWFLAGRPRRRLSTARSDKHRQPDSGKPARPAPDDDIDFLRSLDQATPQRRQEDPPDSDTGPQRQQ